MTHEEVKIALVRASRRRFVVRVRVGGASSITGTVGFVNEREALVIERRTLRPCRVFLGAIEGVEVLS